MKGTDKNFSYTVARQDDGTIQINFTILKDFAQKQSQLIEQEIAEGIEIPGFRKGKAPADKVKEKIDRQDVVNKVLNKALPDMFSEVLEKEKIKPVVYPKFEVLSVDDDKDWSVRALTCEMPAIKLSDYESKISTASNSSKIWTPDKSVSKDKEEKDKTPQEKEALVVQALLESADFKIPKILIDEEVNSRLSKLLERIEKLGLSLESYLQSIGKTVVTLRKEYEMQAENALKIDFILLHLAEVEK
jgi:FKBP-type peptidyl-prolyl cis-trans isomerase (trigger factor)